MNAVTQAETKQITRTGRLWHRLMAKYGAQKMAVTWGDVSDVDLVAEWEPMLNRYTGETIGKAIEALTTDWPPTLTEFESVCRDFQHAAHRPAQPYADAAPTDAKQLTMTDRSGERTNLRQAMQKAVSSVDGGDPTRWIGKLLALGPKKMSMAQRTMLVNAISRSSRSFTMADLVSGDIPMPWSVRYSEQIAKGYGRRA